MMKRINPQANLENARSDCVIGDVRSREIQRLKQPQERDRRQRKDCTEQQQVERPKVRGHHGVLDQVLSLLEEQREEQQSKDRNQEENQCLGENAGSSVVSGFQGLVTDLLLL